MSATKQIRELASMICRRGQTIYGREEIVELCTKSGVSLLDTLPEEEMYQDPPEALMDFISRYSRLSNASRFTVLVLSRLLDVSLPEDITKKKVNIADFLSALPEFFSDLQRDLLGG